MKRMLIDTNIYSFAMRGDPQVIEMLQLAEEIGVSAITIGELLSGFKGGHRETEIRHELERFLDAPRVALYCVNEDTAGFYAAILSELRTPGRPIPTNDLWIAAVARQHGLRLYTQDRHFACVPGLLLVA